MPRRYWKSVKFNAKKKEIAARNYCGNAAMSRQSSKIIAAPL
jgi:hypothetical protein